MSLLNLQEVTKGTQIMAPHQVQVGVFLPTQALLQEPAESGFSTQAIRFAMRVEDDNSAAGSLNRDIYADTHGHS